MFYFPSTTSFHGQKVEVLSGYQPIGRNRDRICYTLFVAHRCILRPYLHEFKLLGILAGLSTIFALTTTNCRRSLILSSRQIFALGHSPLGQSHNQQRQSTVLPYSISAHQDQLTPPLPILSLLFCCCVSVCSNTQGSSCLIQFLIGLIPLKGSHAGGKVVKMRLCERPKGDYF